MTRLHRLLSAGLVVAALTQPAVAQTPNRAELEKAVAARHGVTVKALQDWIALPTIAAERRNVAEGAAYMVRLAQEAGFVNAKVVPTDGLPGVFGTIDVGAPVTMGVYFMYDVKQFDPAEWTSPPLEARIVDRPGEGKAIVGRGSVNQKGPEMAFLAALHALKAAGRRPPVNIVLVAEGEEEIASPNFHQIVQNPEVMAALKRTAGVFIPFNAQDRDGSAGVNLGAKGAVELQLIVGGETSNRYPKSDTHSSSHARIANPAWRLVKALDTLVADDGYTAAVDGWMENVKPLTARQRELVEQLSKRGSEADAKKASGGVGRWLGDDDYRSSIERLISRPTINIQGLVSGYSGPGGKTVLPSRAEAKIDLRLVPDQTRDEVVAKLRAHLAKHGFDDVKVNVSGGYGPNQTDENAPLIRAQKAVLDRWKIPYVINPRLAGSWPGVVFTGPPLGLPAGQIGIGRGGGAHAPDEWFLIESSDPKVAGMKEQTLLYVDLMYELAKQGRR
ncbi:M20/M25/M40 family metallo-hydrolase [Sphingomonas lutea]|uniref:M20/M25/M40 family metallo-hydrolase n=1 Tax=Sphingomonas lutea TaxID=1045317 RepID=A0A7G9SJC0_9SPHN|nr:M20/M25/M40 family metallo-hydrolase [Sphingomonas lutea]QNN67945.1 M20/M25/M40 family metallo-hydrolase [Sphingomonas lutea]